jgi:hypothetical protein
MFGSYVEVVSKWFLKVDQAHQYNVQFFEHFVNLIGIGCFLNDGVTARMALQVSYPHILFSNFLLFLLIFDIF